MWSLSVSAMSIGCASPPAATACSSEIAPDAAVIVNSESVPLAAFAVYAKRPFCAATSQQAAPCVVETEPLTVVIEPSWLIAYDEAELDPAGTLAASEKTSVFSFENAKPNGAGPLE